MSDTRADPRFEIHSSRFWALLHLKITSVVFPLHMYADRHGISTVKVAFWLTPWIRSEEHLPMSHMAEIGLDRGLIWDAISIESSGGLNPLTILGLPKGRARAFVEHVRAMMGP